jgi:outer membrane protein assembly factor BamB
MTPLPDRSDRAHVADWLPAFVNGSLPSSERARVQRHLAECSRCRAELTFWQATRGATRHGLDAVPMPSDRVLAHVREAIARADSGPSPRMEPNGRRPSSAAPRSRRLEFRRREEPPALTTTMPLPGAPVRPDRSETWARWSTLGVVLLIGALLGVVLLRLPPESRGFAPGMATPGASPAASWPMYRGDAARTGVAITAGPLGAPVQRWRTQVQGGVHSAPAVAGGVVYVGSDDQYFHAFDAATGKEQWRFATNGAVSSSPAVAGGLVYFGSDDQILYALDARTGKAVWRFPAARANVSPAVADGVVYAGGADANLYALDAATGKERWRAPVGGASSAPAVGSGLVVVGGLDGRAHALDQATGQERWQFAVSEGAITTPVIANSMVYVGALPGDMGDPTLLYALDAATGAKRWTFATASSAMVYAPVATADALYAGSADGAIYAIDAATGKERWRFTTGGQVTAGGALAGDVLYMAGADHTLYALHASDGTELWRFALDGAVDADPAVANGTAYVGTDLGGIYAIAGGATAAPGAGGTHGAGAKLAPATPTSPVIIPLAPAATLLWESAGTPRFDAPANVATAPDGRLWVADGNHSLFQIFDPDGTFVETWGEPGSGIGQFNFVRANGDAFGAVAFASDGSFYVADEGNARIQQFDRHRQFVRSWGSYGSGDGQFISPIDVAVDAHGKVFVDDDMRNDIQTFDSSGRFLGKFSGPGSAPGQLNSQGLMTVDGQGRVWIADYGNHRIEVWDNDGTFLKALDGGGVLKGPDAIAVGTDGRLYVADSDAALVVVLTADGVAQSAWDRPGPDQPTFLSASWLADLVVTAPGEAVVVDLALNRVEAMRLTSSPATPSSS